jgi:single-strand DNA-binding protein
MPGINHTTFGGNIVRDPELRVTPKGTPICSFTVANNRRYKDAAGNDQQKVTYLDCVAWGKTGEIIAKHFSSGSPIIVWGNLELDQWEDKNTKEKRSKIKLTINFPSGGFDFCGEKRGGGQQSGGDQEQERQERHSPPAGSSRPAQENLDEDVPF